MKLPMSGRSFLILARAWLSFFKTNICVPSLLSDSRKQTRALGLPFLCNSSMKRLALAVGPTTWSISAQVSLFKICFVRRYG